MPPWTCASSRFRWSQSRAWPRSTTSSTSSCCCRSWARSNGRCPCRPPSPMRCSRRRQCKPMRRIIVSGVIALAALGIGATAIAADDEPALKQQHWQFKGPFGTYDRASAQRGFQVYKEVCSACHSLSLLSYRNLEGLGLNENEVKGIAAEFQVPDIGDDGSAIDRPARPSDHFRKPFPNELAAAAANGGKAPPDLSVMIKARPGGPDYVYSLLTGYVPFDQLKPEQVK